MGLPVAVVIGLVTGGAHRALILGAGYACFVALIRLPVNALVGLLSWRGSEDLWRERMASGFYKTLSPVEDDDD